jgi:hypothetical protein
MKTLSEHQAKSIQQACAVHEKHCRVMSERYAKNQVSWLERDDSIENSFADTQSQIARILGIEVESLDDNHDPESGCIAMADLFDSFSQPALAAQARLAEEPEHVTNLATEARRMAHLFNQWESANDLLSKYGI